MTSSATAARMLLVVAAIPSLQSILQSPLLDDSLKDRATRETRRIARAANLDIMVTNNIIHLLDTPEHG